MAPKVVEDGLETKPHEEHEYLHIVKPRKDFDPRLLGPNGMRFESWEISMRDRAIIPVQDPLRGTFSESSGFDTMPYIYSRFTVNPAEKHGRGPSMLILEANKTLQEQARSQLLAAQMNIEPPILTVDDGLLAHNDVSEGLSLVPAALNSGWLDSNGNPRARPFDNGYKHLVAEDMLAYNREVINDAHLVTLFQILIDQPNMTATEALLRAQEKGQLITPTVGRQQDEMLGKTIERELDILGAQGVLPEPPPVLLEAAGEYEIEYKSAATRLQREEEIQAIRAGLADIVPMSEIDPTVPAIVNWQATGRFILEARGMPPSLINSEEQVREIIRTQSEQAEEEQLSESLPGMAKAAVDLQKANLLPAEVQAAVGG
jgi:hypothetical protein